MSNFIKHKLNPKNVVFGFLIYTHIGCFNGRNNLNNDFEINQKYYLGKTSPMEFQTTVENILLYHGYIIESYDNNQTATTISTRWKIREPNSQELNAEILEIKTKFLIEGKIISDSFSINNGFNYECFLYLKNLAYKNNRYVELYNNSISFEGIQQIVNEFRSNFIYHE